ncbi:hypothetical protein CHS0354_018470 [Potamilus streckersoni]|uniref:Uncharacterized protein n=1 Tax=Potamilus streckersoni TaxID=2493646 RepID=A0AAE0TAP3_9BIVA|nr:hypothetical protein CHS0354_018470 [Potamilus streckersoni]
MNNNIPLLLAMPGLDDGIFRRSVILLAEHDDEGAMGFAVNLDTRKTLNDVLLRTEPGYIPDRNFPILLGGPVKTEFFWVLHPPCETDFKSTLKFFDELYITSGHEVLPYYVRHMSPKIYGVGVGYSGWNKQQLEQEIKNGSWWETTKPAEELFSIPLKKRWEYLFKELGVNLNCFYDTPNSCYMN